MYFFPSQLTVAPNGNENGGKDDEHGSKVGCQTGIIRK